MENIKNNLDQKLRLILVVDDDRDIRTFLKIKLSKIGYNIIEAPNGHEAIEKAKKFRPDLITLDLRMPIMDGAKACHYLKEHKDLKYIPIIIVSAIKDLKSKAAAFSLGADDYITKPIDLITLVARIRSILRTKDLQDQVLKSEDKKAISDSLFDYQHLFERIEVEFGKCRKEKKPLSILYLDVDNTKLINTIYGHKTGDIVIKNVREITYDRLNQYGIILNSNTDKIFVILPKMNEDKIRIIAGEMSKEIRNKAFPMDMVDEIDIRAKEVTVSMGLVTWDKVEGVSSEKLLSITETSLKNAKEEGKNRNVQFQFYSKSKDGKHIIDKKVIKESGEK
ncbi:response regulator [candidate division KSB1 bacterium]